MGLEHVNNSVKSISINNCNLEDIAIFNKIKFGKLLTLNLKKNKISGTFRIQQLSI
jgi:hypothetical protein